MYRGLQTAPHVVLKVARTTTDIVQALSMDRYFSLFHVSVDEVAGSSEVDVALHAHGRGCKVRLYTDNYQAASEIASQTDLVVTLPRQLARRHAQEITQLPFDWPQWSSTSTGAKESMPHRQTSGSGSKLWIASMPGSRVVLAFGVV